MIPLAVGTALAVLALAFVLLPLFSQARGTVALPRAAAGVESPADHGAGAVDALREIEFDRATGKLSDPDYHALKTAYTREALAEMRAAEHRAEHAATVAASSPTAVAEADAAVARSRDAVVAPECPSCGPRPEADALFCSECGRFLEADCIQCGEPVTEPDARFCAACGSALAA